MLNPAWLGQFWQRKYPRILLPLKLKDAGSAPLPGGIFFPGDLLNSGSEGRMRRAPAVWPLGNRGDVIRMWYRMLWMH